MRLYLDITEIKNFINKLKKQREGFLVSACIERENRFEFLFVDHGKEGMITFYFNKKGYTNCVASNKNKDIEREILDALSKDVGTYSKFEHVESFELTIGKKEDNYDEVIVFLQEVAKKCEETKQGFKFTSKYGESVFVVNYKDKFVIQGKSGFLLAQLLPYIQSVNEGYENEIYNIYTKKLVNCKNNTISDYENELRTKMPIAYPLINSHIISIMVPSIMLINDGIDLPDYCAYLFPVYRGLEGCIRQLLKECKVGVDKTFTCFGKSNSDKNRYILTGKGSYNKDQKQAIEALYNYFNNKRNPVFHTDNTLETSTIIEDRMVAKSHIYDTLDIIEKTFKIFSE